MTEVCWRPTITSPHRECNCSLPSKVNGKCVYKGKCRSKCIIYQVECSMCDAIYIGNTQQTFKKRMDAHFSDLLRLLNNGQKSYSFSAHFEQPFNTTTSRTYLHKYMTLKLVNQLSLIGAMNTFTKPYCNLCMEERLTILKKQRDKHVTIMNKNSEIYWACQHKTCFHRFCLSTDDPVLNGWKGWAVKRFSDLMTWNHQRSFLNFGSRFLTVICYEKTKIKSHSLLVMN